MFPKWIRILLKYFDLCGFYTETSRNHQRTTFSILAVHIFMACFFTCSIILFMNQPNSNTDTSLNLVNNSIQYVSAVTAYWAIILESYFQRGSQRQFWIIYDQISEQNFRQSVPDFRKYLIIFSEYLFVFSFIQMLLTQYFFVFVGNYIYFNVTYIIVVKMYQNRIFYYLFFLELVKHELESIQREMNGIVAISKCKNFRYLEQNCLKRIREHYKLVYEMVNCVNEVFGWSQFTTILFALYLPLTDLNWAYLRIYTRTTGYIIGEYVDRW